MDTLQLDQFISFVSGFALFGASALGFLVVYYVCWNATTKLAQRLRYPAALIGICYSITPLAYELGRYSPGEIHFGVTHVDPITAALVGIMIGGPVVTALVSILFIIRCYRMTRNDQRSRYGFMSLD